MSARDVLENSAFSRTLVDPLAQGVFGIVCFGETKKKKKNAGSGEMAQRGRRDDLSKRVKVTVGKPIETADWG